MATAATATSVAGSGEWGFTDGPAATARFYQPSDVAVAPDGSYFVADFGNFRVRRVAPDGTVTTVAGTGAMGSTDGPGEVATFHLLAAIAVDRAGNAFVTEHISQRIRKIARCAGGGWVVSTVIGSGTRLKWPRGIAVDPAGHLVVADTGYHRVVRVDPATRALTAIAGDGNRGFRDGRGAAARFDEPTGVTVDRRGDVFVAELKGNRVRRICAADGVVTTVAGSGARGCVDGAGPTAQFNHPTAVAVDGRGALVVSDFVSKEFRLRLVAASADRTVTTAAVDGAPSSPIDGCAIDRDGSLLVAVVGAHRIFRVAGLGLDPPSAPVWSLRAHPGLASAMPSVELFVATVMLCAMRLDAAPAGANADAVPRLPVEMWLATLSMLRPDQMAPRR